MHCMNRIFPVVPIPATRQLMSACRAEARSQQGAAKVAATLAGPAAALISAPQQLDRNVGAADCADPFVARLRKTLNRLAAVCLLASFSHVAPADDTTTLPNVMCVHHVGVGCADAGLS